MPTDRPRLTVTLTDEMLRDVEDFRFSRRIKTQSAALSELIKIGMQRLESELNDTDEKKPVTVDGLTDQELRFLALYDQLGEGGQSLIDGWLSLTPPNRRLLLAILQAILQQQ